MNDFVSVSGILGNIVANVIFWLLGGIVIGLILGQRRRRLHRFFGILQNPQITVYLSSLLVERHSAKNSYGRQSGYSGYVIPDKEFYEIPRISKHF